MKQENFKGLVKSVNHKDNRAVISGHSFQIVGKAVPFFSKIAADMEVEYGLDKDKNVNYIIPLKTEAPKTANMLRTSASSSTMKTGNTAPPTPCNAQTSDGYWLEKDRRISRLANINAAIETVKMLNTKYSDVKELLKEIDSIAEHYESRVYRTKNEGGKNE